MSAPSDVVFLHDQRIARVPAQTAIVPSLYYSPYPSGLVPQRLLVSEIVIQFQRHHSA
jgi:hypothetical protein